MALTSAVPVRFTATQDARLRAMSKGSGIPVSHLIRMAVDRFLDANEGADHLTVPLHGNRVTYPEHPPDNSRLNEKGGSRK
jgi:hypothetical protein